jgi:hypothetical protein
MKKLISTLVFAGAAASQLGSTDCGQALRDSGFDLWCGDQLCAWKVERGDVARVPTWNKGDPGVELVGDDVAIEQLSPVTSLDGTCLEFDLIANVDEDSEVMLDLDVFGDGSVEHSERIPTSHWKELTYKLPIQGVYAGVRFELTKKGTGHAVLAQISAKTTNDCTGFDAIVPGPAPNGAPCTDATGCTSGRCGGVPLFVKQCVGCDGGSGECPGGDVCGIGDPTSPVRGLPLECELAASRQLGENCLFGDECASNRCTDGACSTCDTDNTGCANGETCGPAWPVPTDFPGLSWHTPYLCAPGLHVRKAGEPCASDDDCASASCAGSVRKQCDDGRSCATAADCPFGGTDTETGLQNGPCNTAGVQGGTCQ